MDHSTETSHGIAQGPSSGSARSEQIGRFRSALNGIIRKHQDSEEAALNALVDFFMSRCRNTQQLNTVGAKIFTALNREASVSVTTGAFNEEFTFRREQDDVRIEVDHQCLARIPLDSAIRLATLLHGARELTQDRQCAA